MDEEAGKAQRVTGFFGLMVAAGILFDTGALVAGSALAVAAAAVFGWGLVAGHRKARELAPYRGGKR